MSRSDAAAKLSGEVVFGPDLEAVGMLWGALVPAPVAHGEIIDLDLSEVRRQPGVMAAVGAADLERVLPHGPGAAERPVFPARTIMYQNQPIAAVAATSLEAARAAVSKARIEVEPLPVVSDIESIFPTWPAPGSEHSPHVIAHVHARHGDLEHTFEKADLVHSETFRTSGIAHVALEPHACVADVHNGMWRLRTTTQTPFGTREDTAEILGLSPQELIVEGTWVGGGFGGKGAAFLEPYALVLAAASGRPVRLTLTYREEFLMGRSTMPSIIRLDTSVKNGKITGRRVRLLLDTGSSLPGRDFATGYSIGFLIGPYRTPAFDVEGFGLRTNKPPFGPHRAPFAPQCAFAVESHIDGLARRLGVDPIEFRLAHALREGDSTFLGQAVHSFGLVAALEKARETARLWRVQGSRDHGIGVGVGFWATGTGAGGEARVRLQADRLVVEQGEREIGSGSVIRGLVAVAERTTGLPTEAIELRYLDTERAPFDSGVFGSRTVGALGQAVMRACERILTILSERGPVGRAVRLSFENGKIHAVVGSTKTPVDRLFDPAERKAGAIVAEGRHYGSSGAIDASRVVDGTFYPYSDFTAAVHLARIAIDRETGSLHVLRYVAIHDVGVTIDGPSARAQVEGGVAMGLGTALTEELLWTSDGRLRNPGLLDYRVPTMSEVPPIGVELMEGFPGAGPFGAKGLGEPPIIPVPAAVGNALADATGSRVTELPLTPERVARALKLL